MPKARVFQINDDQLLAHRISANVKSDEDITGKILDNDFASSPEALPAVSPKFGLKEKTSLAARDAAAQAAETQARVRISKRMEYTKYFKDLGLLGLIPVGVLLIAHTGVEKGSRESHIYLDADTTVR